MSYDNTKFKQPKRRQCLESAARCFEKRRCHICFMALREIYRIRLAAGQVVDVVKAMQEYDFQLLGESYRTLTPEPIGPDVTVDFVELLTH